MADDVQWCFMLVNGDKVMVNGAQVMVSSV